MVIRRIREHVVDHNWFAVGIDIAIVVVGVFLGLQANNWNTVRIERAEAQAYRSQIIENLRANEIDIGARTAYYRQVRAYSVAALKVLETPGAAKDEAFLINIYQSTQVWQRPLVRSAYDEMLAAGVSGNVGAPELRSNLTAFYAQLPQFNDAVMWFTAFRDILRRAMPYAIQQRARERCGDTTRRLPSGVLGASLPADCVLGLDSDLIAQAGARIAATQDLNLDLTRHIADIDQKLGAFRNYGRRARQLREHLEALDD